MLPNQNHHVTLILHRPRHPSGQRTYARTPTPTTSSTIPHTTGNTQQALETLAAIFEQALPRVTVTPRVKDTAALRVPETKTTDKYNTRSQPTANLATTVNDLKPRTPDSPLSDTFIQAQTLGRLHIPNANALIDTETGKAMEYNKLLKDPRHRLIWSKSSANEFGRLTQGIRDIPGTDTFHLIAYSQQVPKGRITTYARFCCNIRPPKAEQEHKRITVGRDRIDYDGDVSTQTADLTTSKCLWNIVLSKRKQGSNARYACFDISNFYLNTPMEKPEYM
jgi:hypothetical protein